MGIIPHKRGFVQVSFPSNGYSDGKSSAIMPIFSPILSRSFLDAHLLYDQGLNVFPQPHGQKNGYSWRRLQYTRLPRQDVLFGMGQLVGGDCNLAVMCGATSGNLFVLDCETTAALNHQMEILRRKHVPLWVVKTARGGHIYLRARDGEVHNVPTGTLSDMEVRGRHGYVLAPPSLHPSGVRYEWLLREGDNIPVIDAARLDHLRDLSGKRVALVVQPRGKQAPRALPVLSPYSPLSKTTRDYIANGNTIPEGSRNNRLFAAACDLAGNGYSLAETSAVLTPVAVGSGLLQQEIAPTLQSAYSQTRTPSRPANAPVPQAPHTTWSLALVYASLHRWQGAGASSERALFLALVERARVAINERGVFRASIRELATLARMGVNTVRRILTDFQGAHPPLLFHVGQDALSGASTWRFSDAVLNATRQHLRHNPDAPLPAHWVAYTHAVIHSDAVERGGVGKSPMFLYQYMRVHQVVMMPSALAAAAGMSINQVNYSLARLREFGLIVRQRTGWCVASLALDANEHVLAQKPHLRGKGEARARKFAMERARFVARLVMRSRLQREGNKYAALLHHVLPSVLSRDALSEEIDALLTCPSADWLFETGGTCTLDSGVSLRYIALAAQ